MNRIVKSVREYIGRSVSILLILSFAGCSLVDSSAYQPDRAYRRDVMEAGMEAVIIDQWQFIKPYLAEEGLSRSMLEEIDPAQVVAGMLEEDGGLDYLTFSYAVAVTADVDAVLEQAKKLLPAEVYAELLSDADQMRRSLEISCEAEARALNEENREDFMRDLQQLVARSIVLLTAAVVYAFMPNFMIMGKISAAAAISIAAGATAITVMSIWRYYKFGGETLATFEQWLKDVASEPKVSYALATSVVSMAGSMEFSPIGTALILGVFAIYQAVDMIRSMIAVYEL